MKTSTESDLVKTTRLILETEVLSSTEKLVLVAIIHGPAKTDRKDLMSRTSIRSRDTLHRNLGRLIAMNVVTLDADPEDGRRKQLVIHSEKLG